MDTPSEKRVRKELDRHGYKLRKSRATEPTIDNRGLYGVQRRSDGRWVAGADYSLELATVQALLVTLRKSADPFDELRLDLSAIDELEFDPSSIELLDTSCFLPSDDEEFKAA